MTRISCKKLAEKLHIIDTFDGFDFMARKNTHGVKAVTEDIKSTCEAFGRNVYAYLNCGSEEQREKFQRWLTKNKISFNSDYWPGSGVAEVAVTYFKAWHWDE